MNLSRGYLATIAIQSSGPLSMLLLSFAIVHSQGAAVQGEFASMRAKIDLIAAFGMFGLPQSIVLAVNRFNTSRGKLFQVSLPYIFACLVFVFIAELYTGHTKDVLGSLLLAIAAAMLILMAIWRGILLTIDDGFRFNLITVLPTLAVVVITVSWLVIRLPLQVSIGGIFAGASLVSALLSFLVLREPLSRSSHLGEPPNYHRLLTDGFDMFVVIVCGSAQIYICYYFLGLVGGHVDVGHMSIALMVLNALNFPWQSISPILLNRWCKSTSANALFDGGNEILLVATVSALFSGMVAWILSSLTPYLFSTTDQPSPTIWLILFSTVPSLLVRISAMRLAAIGEVRFNSIMALLQTAIFVFILFLFLEKEQTNPVGVAVQAWLLGDLLTASIYLFKVRMERRRHIRIDESL